MSAAFCLIGHPLGHSLSPYIHKRLFALSGLNGDYTLCDIAPNTLGEEFPALLSRIKGCNVTIPHKQQVLPYLDRLEGKAAIYQTVNTVAVTENGTVGYNTDADGFLHALEDADIPLKGRVCLLGAGGAGTVLAFEAALHGCEVIVSDPFAPAAAEALCKRLREIAAGCKCEAATALPAGEFDLLLNSSPVGMYPKTDACPVPDEVISRAAAVFDVIYNPRQTLLLQEAAANGAKTAGGMAMLVWQAAIAQQHWYGAQFDKSQIADIIDGCYDELARRF